MAGRPDSFMPIYWGDYLADTGHLTAAEHGAYMLLIGRYWTSGAPLPDDDAQLRRTSRMTMAEWKRARPTLAAFFELRDGRWRHKRVDSELARAALRYAQRAEGARIANAKRGAPRAHGDALADRTPSAAPDDGVPLRPHAPQLQLQPQPESPDGDAAPDSGSLFDRFWTAYPHRGEHSDPKKPAREKFARIVRGGIDAETVIRAAARYAATVRGRDPEKVAQAITWLNQARWEQYSASSAPAAAAPASGPLEQEVARWRARLELYVASGHWFAEYGSRPEEAGATSQVRRWLGDAEVDDAAARRRARAPTQEEPPQPGEGVAPCLSSS
jgi:uncharacterized protein YdaU (DUF1376 family)